MAKVLDCGHANDFEGSGVGCRDARGRSLCRACALENERAALKEDPTFFAYVRRDDRGEIAGIATWLGAELGERIGPVTTSRANIARKLQTFRVRDIFGATWACRHWPDAGDYVRMTRVRGARVA